MGRLFCFMPKKSRDSLNNDIGVIGGTFIKGGDHRLPREEEFERVLEDAKLFLGIKD
jgi:hypothetical protein